MMKVLNASVFLLQHLHVLPDGEENVKIIGVYESHEAALAAISRLKKEVGFCDFPSLVDTSYEGPQDGFYIDRYEIGQDNWTEGFVTV